MLDIPIRTKLKFYYIIKVDKVKEERETKILLICLEKMLLIKEILVHL